jgi:hypothetical protein
MRAALGNRGLRDTANRDWVHKLARVGFATKGAVYVLIGILSFDAARSGTAPAGNAGAVREIHHLPFGSALLLLTGVGLMGYALWTAIQALLDPDRDGSDAKGWLKRTGYMLTALLYSGLAVVVLKSALAGGAGPRDSTKSWIGKLMSEPFGHWLVLAVGVGLLIFAGAQLVQAVTGSFARHLDHFRMTYRERRFTMNVGRLGLSARGIVFALMGVFIIRASLDSNPNEAKSMAGALRHLQAGPTGPAVLGVVAVGLVCYGLFMFVCARFRRMQRV